MEIGEKNLERNINFDRLPLAWILIGGFIVALLVWYFASTVQQKDEEIRFEQLVRLISDPLELRVKRYELALVQATAFFRARNMNVTPDEFKNYVKYMQLFERYPGAQGLSFTVYLPKQRVNLHTGAFSNLNNSYKLWPLLPTRNQFSSIVYLEPSDWRNKRAIGFDMFTEPVRREAMELARDTGEPALTGKLTLIQETEVAAQPGFILYVPIYKNGLSTDTIERRREALVAYVSAVFRIHDLMKAIVPEQNDLTDYQLYDSDVSENNLVFDHPNKHSTSPQYTRERSLQLAGRTYVLKVQSLEKFSSSLRYLIPLSIALIVILFSSMVYWFTARLRKTVNVERQTRDELRTAKSAAESANAAKSSFLANMSHEIRTPLGVIQGFADLLYEDSELNVDQKESLATIRRNARQLTNLIGEILDLSKVEAKLLDVERVAFSIRDLMEDVRSTLRLKAEEKGLALQIVGDPNLPPTVVSDPTRLRQILVNLIGNAIKFTAQGSVRVAFSVSESGDFVVVVRDTGIGMTPQQRDRLFQPFVQGDQSMTRRFGGTGLGLSISRKLAEALGGKLELESSTPKVGSTFKLVICCVSDSQTRRHLQSTLKQIQVPDLSLKNILLVEDSKDNQALIVRMLADTKSNVSLAQNGREGLEAAKQKPYDLILMDIQMPEMDGYQAIQKMREASIAVPIIALTAHALTEERLKAEALGFNAYLTKPITKAALFNVLDRFLV